MPDEKPKTKEQEFMDLLRMCEGFRLKKVDIARRLDIDPSTVTRWFKNESLPTDLAGMIDRLLVLVNDERTRVGRAVATEVTSWLPLISTADDGVQSYVPRTGLLASCYYVIACWVPPAVEQSKQYDVIIYRFFQGVWADMSKKMVYNLGDISQTVPPKGDDWDRPNFTAVEEFGSPKPHVEIRADDSVDNSVAKIEITLNLAGQGFADNVIGFLGDGGFGYRYTAKNAILRGRIPKAEETNEFLGAPIVMPCRRFKLIVCIPSNSFTGSPEVLSYSNRMLLSMLMKLDTTPDEEVNSLLWPLGTRSGSPPLQKLTSVSAGGQIERFPKVLQDELKKSVRQEEQTGDFVRDVMVSDKSQCFLLDLDDPHPSLTYTIVWRLATVPHPDPPHS